MATLIRTVTNNSAYEVPVGRGVVIPASATSFDLLAVCSEDILWKIQSKIIAYVDMGNLTVVNTFDSTSLGATGTTTDPAGSDKQIQVNDDNAEKCDILTRRRFGSVRLDFTQEMCLHRIGLGNHNISIMKKLKGDGEMKTKMNEKVAVVSLAFRVKSHGDNLFSAEMLLLRDDKIVERRNGIATTLGHAIGAADDLMDGWAFNEIEQKAEDYFKAVYL